MHVLIIKLSSLGDVIHTLPALTDATRALPGIRFDWVVESAYAEIPAWHPAVDQVLPVSLRQWRKQLWHTWRSGTWQNFRQHLRARYYDQIIDAQGLLKSAALAYQAHGLRSGLAADSAREPLAAWVYQQRHTVPRDQHAVTRLRQLFALSLGYPQPSGLPDYGLPKYSMTTLIPARPTLVFLHGTTWPTKHWPDSHWLELALTAARAGFRVRLPWGNEVEHARAQRIAEAHPHISVIPATGLQGLAAELSTACAVVGVDTGLVHLAAALQVPSLSLYGATDPALTGSYGERQSHLQSQFPCAPCVRRRCHYTGSSTVFPACFEELSVTVVWEALLDVIAGKAPALQSSAKKNPKCDD